MIDSYLASLGDRRKVTVAWTSTVKPAAAHKARVLTKHVVTDVRVGITYEEATGLPGGPLPWGAWTVDKYIIEHKGNAYARMYVVPGTVATTYEIDGESVDRDAFNALLTPAVRESRPAPGGTVTVKLQNVTVLS